MEIAPAQLEKFRALYREKFNIELTPKEALEKALPLLNLMTFVYQPMKQDELQQVQERKRSLFFNYPI